MTDDEGSDWSQFDQVLRDYDAKRLRRATQLPNEQEKFQ